MTTLERIKAEIQKVLDVEGDSENARAQALALMWVLEIIDKYASEECDNDCEHCAYLECPKESCDDAVSRQAVLDLTWEEPSYTDALNVLTEIRDKVEQLPSVQPKEKTGHWKKWEYSTRRCSECDCIVTNEYKFCPDCGAYMIGEK